MNHVMSLQIMKIIIITCCITYHNLQVDGLDTQCHKSKNCTTSCLWQQHKYIYCFIEPEDKHNKLATLKKNYCAFQPMYYYFNLQCEITIILLSKVNTFIGIDVKEKISTQMKSLTNSLQTDLNYPPKPPTISCITSDNSSNNQTNKNSILDK